MRSRVDRVLAGQPLFMLLYKRIKQQSVKIDIHMWDETRTQSIYNKGSALFNGAWH